MANATQSSGGETGSIMGYFRPILEANPKLLKSRKNDALYSRWLTDHPGHAEVPEQVRNGLANLKSVLRKQLNIHLGKRGRKAKAETPAAAAPSKHTGRVPVGQLQQLEHQIDECLAQAKQFGSDGLGEIVQLLRHARNRVVVAQVAR